MYPVLVLQPTALAPPVSTARALKVIAPSVVRLNGYAALGTGKYPHGMYGLVISMQCLTVAMRRE